MTRKTRTTTPGAVGLLVGLKLLVLSVVVAAVAAFVVGTVGALVAAVAVLVGLLLERAQWLASDIDRPRAEAKLRLDRVLSQLRRAGVAAAGAVGDDTPSTTIGDGLLRFDPDHVVFALRSREYVGWQERGLTDVIEDEIRVPLTAFAVAGAERPEAQAAGATPAHQAMGHRGRPRGR